ncbi:MAG: dephospho-CoA kinase [Bdellovibrionales bacterium]
MKIVGLTGGIGMGKSTAAAMLRRMGFPVHEADSVVHALLRKGGAGVKPVAKLFPGALRKQAIDRKRLGLEVFAKPARLKRLEKILHPLVQAAEAEFLAGARRGGARAAILDIPLLFETGAEKRCDAVICVTAPKALQRARVMARPGMTAAKFRAIVKRQMPDTEKRRRADYRADTGSGLAATRRQLRHIMDAIVKGSHA